MNSKCADLASFSFQQQQKTQIKISCEAGMNQTRSQDRTWDLELAPRICHLAPEVSWHLVFVFVVVFKWTVGVNVNTFFLELLVFSLFIFIIYPLYDSER